MTQQKDLVDAFEAFIVGCKADGIWDAIKACCVLAAWNNLNGALIPLKGSAPTNFNFVAADYNRATGLKGDGSTKYLSTNRNNNADPQDSNHNAVYVTTVHLGGNVGQYLGTGSADAGRNNLGHSPGVPETFARNRTATASTVIGTPINFLGHTRDNSSSYIFRANSTSTTTAAESSTPENAIVDVFTRAAANYANGRISFYSIGESLDLAKLDARVSTLMTAIGAAV